MNRKLWMILILFVIACISGFFVWKAVFQENDQELIERRMNEVAKMIGKSGEESYVVQLEQAHMISNYFDDTCDVRLPKFHKEAKMTRQNVEQNILTVRKMTTSLELKFYEMKFHFQEGSPKRCKVCFTGMLNAKTRFGDTYQEGYELEMNWVKKDGEWLIEGIGFSEILNK